MHIDQHARGDTAIMRRILVPGTISKSVDCQWVRLPRGFNTIKELRLAALGEFPCHGRIVPDLGADAHVVN